MPTAPSDPAIYKLEPEHLPKVWSFLEKHLQSVVDRSHGDWTLEAIFNAMGNGALQLWMVWDGNEAKAVVGTELATTETDHKICTMRFCAGDDSPRWLHLLDIIEDWARHQGCRRMEAVARKGWAKRLADYKMTHVHLMKDLG